MSVALVSAGELYGGVERFIVTFSRYLLESGQDRPAVALFSDGELARQLRAANVPVDVVPYRLKFDPRAIGWLADFFRRCGARVVHAHGYKAGVAAGLAARRAGLPAVKTEHGAMEPFTGLAALKMRVYDALDRWVTARCFDEIVYITSDLMRRKRWMGRQGARVIHNGLPAMTATPNLAAEPAFGSGKFHIGIVGRLSPVKGHSVLFQAARMARNRSRIRLHVFGDGPLGRKLREEAKGLDGAEVIFHGFRADIYGAMSVLDCLAMPSRHEGLPYTLLEAMHLRLPIVASRVGGLKEVLRHRRSALLFQPGDARGLADVLDNLMEDDDLRSAIAGGAREEARSRFGIEAMATEYLRLYQEARLS